MSGNEIKARKALFEIVDDATAVMLGAEGAGEFMQPMSPQFDKEDQSRTVWFFTKSDTDLAKAAKKAVHSKMCVMDDDGELYACVSGKLDTHMDEEIVEKYWSPVVSAWFEDGKDDPKLTLLRFIPKQASIWVSDASASKFGFEIAKANLVNTTPDLGHHEVIDL